MTRRIGIRFRLLAALAAAGLLLGCTSYPELRDTDWYRQRAKRVHATGGGLLSMRVSAENHAIWVGTVAEGINEIRWEGAARALVLNNAEVLVSHHSEWRTEVTLSYGPGAFPDGRTPRSNEKWAFHASRDSMGHWTVLSAMPLDSLKDQ